MQPFFLKENEKTNSTDSEIIVSPIKSGVTGYGEKIASGKLLSSARKIAVSEQWYLLMLSRYKAQIGIRENILNYINIILILFLAERPPNSNRKPPHKENYILKKELYNIFSLIYWNKKHSFYKMAKSFQHTPWSFNVYNMFYEFHCSQQEYYGENISRWDLFCGILIFNSTLHISPFAAFFPHNDELTFITSPLYKSVEFTYSLIQGWCYTPLL